MHDKNGVLINVGDEVIIRARVESVVPSATTCNITVRTTEKQLPTSGGGDVFSLNANQVEKTGGVSREVQEAAERGFGGSK